MSRLPGLLLGAAIVQLFLTGNGGWLLGLALAAAIVSHLERMAITTVMAAWTPDVATFRHAPRRQREPTTR